MLSVRHVTRFAAASLLILALLVAATIEARAQSAAATPSVTPEARHLAALFEWLAFFEEDEHDEIRPLARLDGPLSFVPVDAAGDRAALGRFIALLEVARDTLGLDRPAPGAVAGAAGGSAGGKRSGVTLLPVSLSGRDGRLRELDPGFSCVTVRIRGVASPLVVGRADIPEALWPECTAHELLHAVGFFNHTVGSLPSILRSDGGEAVLPADFALLALLRDPTLRSGMTRQQAMAQVPSLIARHNLAQGLVLDPPVDDAAAARFAAAYTAAADSFAAECRLRSRGCRRAVLLELARYGEENAVIALADTWADSMTPVFAVSGRRAVAGAPVSPVAHFWLAEAAARGSFTAVILNAEVNEGHHGGTADADQAYYWWRYALLLNRTATAALRQAPLFAPSPEQLDGVDRLADQVLTPSVRRARRAINAATAARLDGEVAAAVAALGIGESLTDFVTADAPSTVPAAPIAS
ncbi:MAG: DUF2927 domain-containing protein, partial [Alphaproteobacteria bacterium]